MQSQNNNDLLDVIQYFKEIRGIKSRTVRANERQVSRRGTRDTLGRLSSICQVRAVWLAWREASLIGVFLLTRLRIVALTLSGGNGQQSVCGDVHQIACVVGVLPTHKRGGQETTMIHPTTGRDQRLFS